MLCPYCHRNVFSDYAAHVAACARADDLARADEIQLARLRAASTRPPGPDAVPLDDRGASAARILRDLIAPTGLPPASTMSTVDKPGRRR